MVSKSGRSKTLDKGGGGQTGARARSFTVTMFFFVLFFHLYTGWQGGGFI